MAYTTEDIRNIALVGHGGAGKTELTDALLHGAGKIAHKGSVDAGTTVSDSDDHEKELRHSLTAGFCHLDHGDVHVNLLDTPGHPDLVGRSLSVLPAVETAAVVVNAATGVEMMTQRAMEAARERRLCRMIVVNRIDADGADTAGVLEQIQDAFGSECLPVNLPADGGARVVDVFFQEEGDDTDVDSVESAHERIVDQVVEVDDDLMEAYLEQGEVSAEQLHDAFEKALRDGHLVPVCFVSAATGAGVPELLDVFAKLMPSPREGNPPAFVSGGTEVAVSADPDGSVVAHVVKVDIDPFRGRMAIFRMHQGTMRRGGQVFVGDARKPLKIGHLLKLNGGEHTEVEAVVAGDVCAIPRAEDVPFGAVLHDDHAEDDTRLEALPLPEPMYGRAITRRERRGGPEGERGVRRVLRGGSDAAARPHRVHERDRAAGGRRAAPARGARRTRPEVRREGGDGAAFHRLSGDRHVPGPTDTTGTRNRRGARASSGRSSCGSSPSRAAADSSSSTKSSAA